MFNIGEKVVCVDSSISRHGKANGLKKDEIYTIIGINKLDQGVILKECKSDCDCGAWMQSRLRKIDYNFGKELANSIVKKIKMEQLLYI